jgi:S1-C subfamily serine protease
MRCNIVNVSCVIAGVALGCGLCQWMLPSPAILSAQAPALPAANRGLDFPGDPIAFDTIAVQFAASVVAVDAVKPQSAATAKSKSQEESGSGVIVRIEPHKGTWVITNNHVVAGAKPDEVAVTLNDGRA